jgi:Flp pilus assembly protein TadB
MSTPRRIAALFALLMLLSTAAFVIGVSVEKSQGHSEPSVGETHTDEGSQAHEEGGSEEGEGAAPQSKESVTIGGIDVESTPLIVVGAVLSLALAGAALRWPRREVFAVAVVFCLGFALLDGRELAHQLDEDASGVAVLAGLTLALHLAVAAAAALALARNLGDRPAVTAA